EADGSRTRQEGSRGVSSGFPSQSVRLINELIDAQQANRVDGSVLFASVLRKIGLDVQLALLPGHMMVGAFLNRQHGERLLIETTMIGSRDLSRLPEGKDEARYCDAAKDGQNDP